MCKIIIEKCRRKNKHLNMHLIQFHFDYHAGKSDTNGKCKVIFIHKKKELLTTCWQYYGKEESYKDNER